MFDAIVFSMNIRLMAFCSNEFFVGNIHSILEKEEIEQNICESKWQKILINYQHCEWYIKRM